MTSRFTGMVACVCFFGCAGDVPMPKLDASRAESDGGQSGGADATPSIDSSPNMQATVTASCLFLREGPGTDQPKVPCTDSGAWCNDDNDVCVPMGETVEVTGGPSPGAGCEQWYPVNYRTYSGWSCGTYLQFQGAAGALREHEAIFPGPGSGPKG